jgi:hypothetical protein
VTPEFVATTTTTITTEPVAAEDTEDARVAASISVP